MLCHICANGYYRNKEKTECIEIPDPPPSNCNSYNKAPDGTDASDNKCTFCYDKILDLSNPDSP